MIGVEIVNPKGRKDRLGHFSQFEALALKIQERCFKNGLIIEVGGRHSAVMRFLPPLTITETETTAILSIFEKSLAEAIQ